MESSHSRDEYGFRLLESKHYFPQFLWRLFLAEMGPRWTHEHRIHVYDVQNDGFEEMRRIPQTKSIFHDFIDEGLEDECVASIKAAEDAFSALEAQAERAIIFLLDSLCSTKVDSDEIMHRRTVGLDSKSEYALSKYLIFLRYRNSEQYHDTVARLGSKASSSYPWMRHIPRGPLRRRAVLRSIVAFLGHQRPEPGLRSVDQRPSQTKPGFFADIEDQCWRPLREGRTEISVGIASEAQEFITTDTWFGNLDDVDPDGFCDGSYHLFFPVSPTVALYLITKPPRLRNPWGPARFYVHPFTTVDQSLDDETKKRKREGSGEDIDDAASFTSDTSIRKRARSNSVSSSDETMDIDVPQTPNPPYSSDILVTKRKLVELSCDIEAVPDVHLRNAILLRTSPRYILFSSLPSMITAITVTPSPSSMGQFSSVHGMGMGGGMSSGTYGRKSIDSEYLISDIWLSKLKAKCREKHIREGLMKTLVVRGSVSVCDLTEDVKLLGDGPIEHGSFADIWKGEWEERCPFGLGGGAVKTVALKVLRQCLADEVKEKLLRRLKDEVLTWHRLHHPHIIQLHGIFQFPKTLAMVSPWCRNGTVVHYLRELNPGADRLKLLVQIASGVAYLHEFKPVVIHGDLKGNNILINDNGQALITDFGVSNVIEDFPATLSTLSSSSFSSSSSSNNCNNNTNNGMSAVTESFFGGAVRWMAHELILALVEDEIGKRPELTKASDVYGFASVCLEIMTGQVPYPHRTNSAAVTMDKMRGVKPSRGAQRRFFEGLEDAYRVIEDDFWSMMDRCWDDWYLRPSMPELQVFFEGLLKARG